MNVYKYKNVVKIGGKKNDAKFSKRKGKLPFNGKNRVITW